MDKTTQSKDSKTQRIVYLDALRGIAAGSVAIKHHILVFGVPASVQSVRAYLPKNFFYDGNPEVAFFFVLSGFVLSLGFFNGRTELKHLSLWRTYLSRAARIYPAFIAIFILSFLAKDWTYAHVTGPVHLKALQNFWPVGLSGENIFRQLTLMPFAERGVPLVSPDWTLIREVKYSLFLPFLVIAAKKSPIWLLLISIFLIGYMGAADYLMSGFCLGIFIAAGYKYIRPYLDSAGLLFKSLLLCLIILLYYLSPILFISRGLTASLAGGLVLCLAFASGRVQKCLNVLPLRFLGKISYSVYLCHFFVLLCIAPFWRVWTKSVQGSLAWDLLFFTICVLLVSSFVYYLAEKPGIWLGRSVRKWRRTID